MPGAAQRVALAVKGLKERTVQAEEQLGLERERRRTLQGRLEDAHRNLEDSRADVAKLERVVARLNEQQRRHKARWEEQAKHSQDKSIELSSIASQAEIERKRAHEVNQRNQEINGTVERLKRQLVEERAERARFQARCKEAETVARVAAELQKGAEDRASAAETAMKQAQNKVSASGKARALMQLQIDGLREDLEKANFQVRALTVQRDEAGDENVALRKKVQQLRAEMDSINALFQTTTS